MDDQTQSSTKLLQQFVNSFYIMFYSWVTIPFREIKDLLHKQNILQQFITTMYNSKQDKIT